MDFPSMKRKQLQALCKKHSISAKLTNAEMVEKLSSLLKGDEEKRVTRGRSCLKRVEDENVSEESDVVDRKVKKVRFSPENETFEFVKSGFKCLEKTRGGRGSSALNNVTLSDEIFEIEVDARRRAAQVSGKKKGEMDVVVAKKRRKGMKDGGKVLDEENVDVVHVEEGGGRVNTRRSLRSKGSTEEEKQVYVGKRNDGKVLDEENVDVVHFEEGGGRVNTRRSLRSKGSAEQEKQENVGRRNDGKGKGEMFAEHNAIVVEEAGRPSTGRSLRSKRTAEEEKQDNVVKKNDGKGKGEMLVEQNASVGEEAGRVSTRRSSRNKGVVEKEKHENVGEENDGKGKEEMFVEHSASAVEEAGRPSCRRSLRNKGVPEKEKQDNVVKENDGKGKEEMFIEHSASAVEEAGRVSTRWSSRDKGVAEKEKHENGGKENDGKGKEEMFVELSASAVEEAGRPSCRRSLRNKGIVEEEKQEYVVKKSGSKGKGEMLVEQNASVGEEVDRVRNRRSSRRNKGVVEKEKNENLVNKIDCKGEGEMLVKQNVNEAKKEVIVNTRRSFRSKGAMDEEKNNHVNADLVERGRKIKKTDQGNAKGNKELLEIDEVLEDVKVQTEKVQRRSKRKLKEVEGSVAADENEVIGNRRLRRTKKEVVDEACNVETKSRIETKVNVEEKSEPVIQVEEYKNVGTRRSTRGKHVITSLQINGGGKDVAGKNTTLQLKEAPKVATRSYRGRNVIPTLEEHCKDESKTENQIILQLDEVPKALPQRTNTQKSVKIAVKTADSDVRNTKLHSGRKQLREPSKEKGKHEHDNLRRSKRNAARDEPATTKTEEKSRSLGAAPERKPNRQRRAQEAEEGAGDIRDRGDRVERVPKQSSGNAVNSQEPEITLSPVSSNQSSQQRVQRNKPIAVNNPFTGAKQPVLIKGSSDRCYEGMESQDVGGDSQNVPEMAIGAGPSDVEFVKDLVSSEMVEQQCLTDVVSTRATDFAEANSSSPPLSNRSAAKPQGREVVDQPIATKGMHSNSVAIDHVSENEGAFLHQEPMFQPESTQGFSSPVIADNTGKDLENDDENGFQEEETGKQDGDDSECGPCHVNEETGNFAEKEHLYMPEDNTFAASVTIDCIDEELGNDDENGSGKEESGDKEGDEKECGPTCHVNEETGNSAEKEYLHMLEDGTFVGSVTIERIDKDLGNDDENGFEKEESGQNDGEEKECDPTSHVNDKIGNSAEKEHLCMPEDNVFAGSDTIDRVDENPIHDSCHNEDSGETSANAVQKDGGAHLIASPVRDNAASDTQKITIEEDANSEEAKAGAMTEAVDDSSEFPQLEHIVGVSDSKDFQADEIVRGGGILEKEHVAAESIGNDEARCLKGTLDEHGVSTAHDPAERSSDDMLLDTRNVTGSSLETGDMQGSNLVSLDVAERFTQGKVSTSESRSSSFSLMHISSPKANSFQEHKDNEVAIGTVAEKANSPLKEVETEDVETGIGSEENGDIHLMEMQELKMQGTPAAVQQDGSEANNSCMGLEKIMDNSDGQLIREKMGCDHNNSTPMGEDLREDGQNNSGEPESFPSLSANSEGEHLRDLFATPVGVSGMAGGKEKIKGSSERMAERFTEDKIISLRESGGSSEYEASSGDLQGEETRNLIATPICVSKTYKEKEFVGDKSEQTCKTSGTGLADVSASPYNNQETYDESSSTPLRGVGTGIRSEEKGDTHLMEMQELKMQGTPASVQQDGSEANKSCMGLGKIMDNSNGHLVREKMGCDHNNSTSMEEDLRDDGQNNSGEPESFPSLSANSEGEHLRDLFATPVCVSGMAGGKEKFKGSSERMAEGFTVDKTISLPEGGGSSEYVTFSGDLQGEEIRKLIATPIFVSKTCKEKKFVGDKSEKACKTFDAGLADVSASPYNNRKLYDGSSSKPLQDETVTKVSRGEVFPVKQSECKKGTVENRTKLTPELINASPSAASPEDQLRVLFATPMQSMVRSEVGETLTCYRKMAEVAMSSGTMFNSVNDKALPNFEPGVSFGEVEGGSGEVLKNITTMASDDGNIDEVLDEYMVDVAVNRSKCIFSEDITAKYEISEQMTKDPEPKAAMVMGTEINNEEKNNMMLSSGYPDEDTDYHNNRVETTPVTLSEELNEPSQSDVRMSPDNAEFFEERDDYFQLMDAFERVHSTGETTMVQDVSAFEAEETLGEEQPDIHADAAQVELSVDEKESDTVASVKGANCTHSFTILCLESDGRGDTATLQSNRFREDDEIRKESSEKTSGNVDAGDNVVAGANVEHNMRNLEVQEEQTTNLERIKRDGLVSLACSQEVATAISDEIIQEELTNACSSLSHLLEAAPPTGKVQSEDEPVAVGADDEILVKHPIADSLHLNSNEAEDTKESSNNMLTGEQSCFSEFQMLRKDADIRCDMFGASDLSSSEVHELLNESEVAAAIKEYIDFETNENAEINVTGQEANRMEPQNGFDGRPMNDAGETDNRTTDGETDGRIGTIERKEASLDSVTTRGCFSATRIPKLQRLDATAEKRRKLYAMPTKSTLRTEDKKSILIHGTPLKRDLKENAASDSKAARVGSSTTVRSAKRPPVKNLPWG